MERHSKFNSQYPKHMRQATPPRLLQKLLSKMFSNTPMEELEGDLLEDYLGNYKKYGRTRANLYYLLDLLRLISLIPRSRRNTQKSKIMNNLFLFNLKYSFRSIKKHSVYQALNIASLTLGFTCFSLIYLFVFNHYQKDNFLENPEGIVRLNIIRDGNESMGIHSGIPYLLKKDIPEIERMSRMSSLVMQVSFTGNRDSFTEQVLSVEPDFMDIFQLETVLGKRFPKEPATVLLSESMAAKLFSSPQEALGKELTLTYNKKSSKKHVAGIFRDQPINSSYSPQIINQLGNYERFSDLNGGLSVSLPAYFKLQKGTDRNALAQKIPENLKNYTDKESHLSNTYVFRTLNEIKNNPKISSGFIDSLDTQTVLIFKIVGLVILLLAVANYINLTTALTLKRTHEVGIKHAMGATKHNLISQLLCESFIIGGISILLSGLFIAFLLPRIESYIGLQMQLTANMQTWVIAISILVLLALVALASLYPAFLFSTTKFSQLLKGKSEVSPKSKLLRTSLMAMQFAISTFLIVGSLTFLKQLQFINKSHNLDHLSNVIIVSGKIGDKKRAIEHRLASLPEIERLSFASFAPGPVDYSRSGLGTDEFKESFGFYVIDEHFLDLMGLNIAEGQSFYTDDRNKPNHVLMNKAMVENVKEGHPLGKEFKLYGATQSKVIGIVENFPIGSLKNQIEPALYMQAALDEHLPGMIKKVAIQLKPENRVASIAKIESEWNKIFPEQPFQAEFMDDRIAKIYTDEFKMGQLFGIFTGVAVVISCLGLVGLLTYLIQIKMKEIGIRKVLGASAGTLTKLLTLNIWKVLLLSSLISFPLSYHLLEDWLTSFVYRTEVSSELFILTILCFVLIVGLAVFWQIRNAIKINPTEVLRND
ncbi:FtsX-like permease family protein [Roseivirga pacifica]|nr:FtsX-like permease family protein [Roseivirga pacifica]MCO6368875.1 FtsX-like permease family protein [Roseivirga pacifica]MCO6373018.1 FtsX-like permease family protein [Roseivirga pacifica]MCO6373098.1 FtsX-like permease family protein [Roseivirga pacifica]MCO6377645.1 FtsX-like permease family protein [Roseivirga pacifica]